MHTVRIRAGIFASCALMVVAGCSKTDNSGSTAVQAAVDTTAVAPTTLAPTTLAPSAAGSESATIKVAITSPAPGASIAGNVVTLTLSASGIDLVKADGDTSGKTGHFHVFVDQDPPPLGAVIPKAPGIIHTAATNVVIRGLAIGQHRFAVVVGNGAHRRISEAVAETTVSVTGPSLGVSTSPTVASGAAAELVAKVDGVTLVPADGDTSGKTGHLHFFIDRPPTPAGQPIPKEAGIIHTAETHVSIPGLAPGPHTVIVVLGDGAHRPFDPPVQAEVSFVVQ